MEKGGGVGWGPILILLIIFYGEMACWKRCIFGFYPEKGIYFLGVLTIFFS